jgi:hypothetical protein
MGISRWECPKTHGNRKNKWLKRTWPNNGILMSSTCIFETRINRTSRLQLSSWWNSGGPSDGIAWLPASGNRPYQKKGTIWLFNIAMEHGPFIDDFPIKTSIYKGFSMAMLNNQRVSQQLLNHSRAVTMLFRYFETWHGVIISPKNSTYEFGCLDKLYDGKKYLVPPCSFIFIQTAARMINISLVLKKYQW